MSTLKGIIRNGQVIVIGPTDLPDGTEVEILPVGVSYVDDEEQMTPDETARTLAATEEVEPFEMSDAERAAIESDRQSRKEWEKAHFRRAQRPAPEDLGVTRFLLDTGPRDPRCVRFTTRPIKVLRIICRTCEWSAWALPGRR